MTGYVRKFESNLTMSFKISNKELLIKYSQILKTVEKLLKIEVDNEHVYGDNDKYIKIKIYAGSMITNFQSKRMPKEKAPYKCLLIIMLDSVIKAKKKVLSPDTFVRMWIWTRKYKNGEPYWWWCESDEFDSDSNDGGECDE